MIQSSVLPLLKRSGWRPKNYCNYFPSCICMHDPQVAATLLCKCGAYCKLVHLACSTPSDLVITALTRFDSDVRSCFEECGAIQLTKDAWSQACLSISRGGFGLRSLRRHSPAASLCASGISSADMEQRVERAREQFIRAMFLIVRWLSQPLWNPH